MILKEKEHVISTNKRIASGDEAERQMAFYLKRKFEDDQKVRVFHDLRIERDGEVAQIDHLLLHKHGFVIIESKSVAGKVHVNEHLEFMYVYGKREVGMASPILQAKRQGELLKLLLQDNKGTLRNKLALGLVQGGFTYCPMDVLVAISDKSVIRRPRTKIPELHKADQIPDAASGLITRHRKSASLIGKTESDWGMYSMSADELDRVSDMLLAAHSPKRSAGEQSTENTRPASVGSSPETAHKPSAPAQTAPAPPPATAPDRPARKATEVKEAGSDDRRPIFLCTHCQSTRLEILYGRSYYFKCKDCDGNTGIKNVCPTCSTTMRTQKRGDTFSTICKGCGSEKVFFVNDSTTN